MDNDLGNGMVLTWVSSICIAIFPIFFRREETNKDPAASVEEAVQRRNVFFVFLEPSNSKPSRKAAWSEEPRLDQNWCVEVVCLIDICKLQIEYARFCTIRLFAVVSLSSVLNCFKKEAAIRNSLLGWTRNDGVASNFSSRFLFSTEAKYEATRELDILRNFKWGCISSL